MPRGARWLREAGPRLNWASQVSFCGASTGLTLACHLRAPISISIPGPSHCLDSFVSSQSCSALSKHNRLSFLSLVLSLVSPAAVTLLSPHPSRSLNTQLLLNPLLWTGSALHSCQKSGPSSDQPGVPVPTKINRTLFTMPY